jgi:UDP-N-acetylmuramyl pentapeptide phosphotransferase/UDP-N-acetylglucosamine-1-phosphate transferase
MLLVFSPFIVDATVTLAKRALRGERVWQAHREHYYQRLVQSGWGHRRVALAAYGLMAATALCALGALHASRMQWIGILAGWAGVYVGLAWLIDRRWRRFLQATR